MKPRAFILFFALITSAHAQLPVNRPPRSLRPAQVAANPTLYQGQTLRIQGQPTVKQNPTSLKWEGTSDGVKVELTDEAKAYYDKVRPTGKVPLFEATVTERDGKLLLIYQKGLPPTN